MSDSLEREELIVEDSYHNDDLNFEFTKEGNCRKDVIFKTVLRDMRKFYKSDFNTRTLFNSRKRKKGTEYIRKVVVNYVS